MTTEKATFGIGVGEAFLSGVRGYFRHWVPLSGAALLTLGAYLAFRVPAQSAIESDRLGLSIALDLAGLVLASTLAYPWYCYAMDAAQEKPIDVGFPLRNRDRFRHQAVASFWFWAAILLGLRYLLGIPSILAALFYAFYGFTVADGTADGGLDALGLSARVGEGKRIGLFALGGVFLVFNLFGAVALGFTVNALTIALAVAGLIVTTNITMVAGARIYRVIQAQNGP